MEQIIMDKIDKGCMPTYGKYVKEQLIGAIVKYAKDGDISSFSNDFNSRKYIEEVGVLGFRQALLEHVVKLDACLGITNFRLITDYDKNYRKHSVGETELRIYETLSLVTEDVFNDKAINDAYKIITKDGVALYNLAKSFVEIRCEKALKDELDTSYLFSDVHKSIIWKIEEHFKKMSN